MIRLLYVIGEKKKIKVTGGMHAMKIQWLYMYIVKLFNILVDQEKQYDYDFINYKIYYLKFYFA
jgi:hypothetical protein